MADVEDGTKSGLNNGLHNGLKFQIPGIRSHLNNSNQELCFDVTKYAYHLYAAEFATKVCTLSLHSLVCSITLICNCYILGVVTLHTYSSSIFTNCTWFMFIGPQGTHLVLRKALGPH